uniref:RenB n=1 Tax=Candidatus Endohaliclona renieramycinifaciens TaxID=2565582 RepID=A0A4D6G3C2_9GAMM|nr:RenB [Candidatus Endohaliclona renieramycinifaciens]
MFVEEEKVVKTNTSNELTMQDITQILFGASAFQYLNAGCELNLFENLNNFKKLKKNEIAEKLNLQQRSVDILLLGTTALKLTEKQDDYYSNCHIINKMFEEGEWKNFKDIVGFEQNIVYRAQVDFSESLRTNSNAGLYNIPGNGRDLYHRLVENPHLENYFYNYMHSWTKLSNTLLFEKIDFGKISRVIDVGGGTGVNSIDLVKKFPHLEVTILEIPATAIIAQKNVTAEGLQDQIKVKAGDMFTDKFPNDSDCVLFSHQLVIWTPEENISLLKKAYDALRKNGRVIIFSSISNDAGDGPLMAALDSVYFATIPAEGGMIYAWKQYEKWLNKAGFFHINRYTCQSWTPHGIIEAIKNH